MVSAHDANASLTVDKYFNAANEEIDDPLNPSGADSIWNYHVWNDVWMARPDLPKGINYLVTQHRAHFKYLFGVFTYFR